MNDSEQKIWGAEQPFIVPNGYFDDFEKQLNLHVDSTRIIKKRTSMMSWIGIAAAFVIGVLVYSKIPEKLFPETTEVAYNEYVIINISSDDLDEYDLIEYIKTQNIDINIFPDSMFFAGINSTLY